MDSRDDENKPYKGHFESSRRARAAGATASRTRNVSRIAWRTCADTENAFSPAKAEIRADRPASTLEVQRLARELSPRAIARLASIMDDPQAPYRDQVNAAVALLDRGNGRPAVGIFTPGVAGVLSGTLEDVPDGETAGLSVLLQRARLAKLNRLPKHGDQREECARDGEDGEAQNERPE